ncbi:MAG: hypothetical protein J2P51_06785 [Hyphomicrobiaceae bacterium]|nr:hypothetical protein [Hyphomicrobiaceae bacterium]
MTTALYLILSGMLIGAGMTIIWRDVRKKSRNSFTRERDARGLANHEVEITIARDRDPEFARRSPARAAAPLAPSAMGAPSDRARALAGVLAGVPGPPTQLAQMSVDPSPPSAHLALERQWLVLQPAITGAVARTNTLIAPVRLAIGPPGEPAWSYKNRGYGIHRRLLIGGQSVAWLRLELLTEGRLRANVKAHRDDGTGLNASAEIAVAGLDGERIGALLLECLKPAMAFAAHQVEVGEIEPSKRTWENVNGMIADALSATNGALAQAGARLIALAPAAWEDEPRPHGMALSVEVNGDDVARMHIERLPHELEVAVGVREPLAALGRRRRIPLDGLTVHALAELIASCAWPVIARFKETRRQA